LNHSNKNFNEYEKALIAKRTKELQANSKSFSIEPSQIVDPYVKNLLIEAINEFTFSKNEKVNQRMKYKFTLAFDNDKELKNAEAVIDKKFSNKSSKDTNAEAVFKLNFATGERMYKAVTNKANTVEIIDLSTGQPVINKTGDKVFKNLGEFYEEQLDKY
jgi:archaellin